MFVSETGSALWLFLWDFFFFSAKQVKHSCPSQTCSKAELLLLGCVWIHLQDLGQEEGPTCPYFEVMRLPKSRQSLVTVLRKEETQPDSTGLHIGVYWFHTQSSQAKLMVGGSMPTLGPP